MAEVQSAEFAIVEGDGCELVDRDGRRYLDATAALWYCDVGYGRDAIAVAVAAQLRRLHAYSCFGEYVSAVTLELCERLTQLLPVPDAKIFLTSGGSDAIDTAAKLARRYWSLVGRPDKQVIVSRRHAYHGMHAYGTSLGGIPANTDGFGPLVPGTVNVAHDSIEELEAVLERMGSDSVAAVIGEPVIGAGGVLPPPDGYWQHVAALCRDRDVLLIADEVITGWGRLGRWFGCERFGIEPDMLVFAKGITSGYVPLGGVAVGPRVQEPFWSNGGAWLRHGYTYSGHATACAAAMANLDILEDEGLVERVATLEQPLAAAVSSLAEHLLVSETRSIGLMAAVELDSAVLTQDPEILERTVAACRRHGVLTRALRGCALHISPAYCVTLDQIDFMMGVLRRALDEVTVCAPTH
jgi:adenosylmethionine-8-amino-7-oxononanoate aminotransferase